MKKWIALLLAIIMCMSFCACGENTNQKEDPTAKILGKWADEEANFVLELNGGNSGMFTRNGTPLEITWKYDDGSRTIAITIIEEDFTGSATYMESDDSIFLEGITLLRVKE